MCLLLTLVVKLTASQGVADFTLFEDELVPQWVARFRVNATPGAYTYNVSEAKEGPSVYGSADVVHVLATTNALNLSRVDADAWIGVLEVISKFN